MVQIALMVAAGDASVGLASANLSISPGPNLGVATAGVLFTPITFTVSGGVEPYTLTGQGFPPGLNLDSSSGILSGTPTQGDAYNPVVQVIDSASNRGTFQFTLNVIDIIPSTLNGCVVGTVCQEVISTEGFVSWQTISYSMVSGALPPGVSGNTVGSTNQAYMLNGTPTEAGMFSFTLQATDGTSIDVRSYTLTVGPGQLQVGGNLPNGILGQPYMQTIPVYQGTPPYTFTTTSTTIPPGLQVSSSGVVSGTPTVDGGPWGFNVSVVDSTGKSGAGTVFIAIVPPPLTLLPATIPNGVVGQPYSVTFSTTNGSPPISYSKSGSVIQGVSFNNATGVLSGTPTAGGTFMITIDASDAAARQGSQAYTFTITTPPPAFSVTPASLPDATLGAFYHQSITTSGATPPVTFVVYGPRPPGISVDTSVPGIATFSGTPLPPGGGADYPLQVVATDATGASVTVNYTIQVDSGTLTLSPGTLPSGTVSVPYAADIVATGGTPPYTFSTPSLPPGPPALTLTSGGHLSGTPTLSGIYAITINAMDSQGKTGQITYQLQIYAANIFIIPSPLPAASINVPYSVTLSASGGTAPYTFALSSGTLPTGLALSSSGKLAGTPVQAGVFQLTITAHDAVSSSGTCNCQLIVAGNPITIGPSSLPDAFLNQSYLAHLTATGGTPLYTFTMPYALLWNAGLNVASDGTISGTPSGNSAATLDFTIQATDATGSSGSQEFLVNLWTAALIISPATLPPATVGTIYSASVTASGGQAPYSFSLTAGSSPPPGLTLSPSGVLAGIPASAGNYPFTVQALDSAGGAGTANYSLTILGLPGMGTCSYVIAPGSQSFPAVGGTASILITAGNSCSWSISGIPSWVIFQGQTSGTGNQPIGYEVLSNSGPARSANLTIAGQPFALEQGAASTSALSPTISLSNPQLEYWGYIAGGSLTPTQTVGVSNTGGGTLSWSASANVPWINIKQMPAGLMVAVNPAGLGQASYPGVISISAPGATNSPQMVTVTLNVISAVSSPQPAPTRFVPITPCRIADTRDADGPFGGPSMPGQTARDFAVPSGACSIPSNATAYSLNVAVVPAAALGYLTLWPTGQPQPQVATLNSDGRIKSNAAIIPAGANGAITVFVTDTTDVVLDINGYFVPSTIASALAFYPVTPCRIADTRNANGPLAGPSLTSGGTRTFPILSSPCGIPNTAQAYSLNFAAVPQGPLGYLTAWPTGQSQPTVATLNAPTGTVVANAVIVPAGTNGGVDVFSTNATDLVIDIDGYFAPTASGGLSFYTSAPCRVLDSRLPVGTPPFSTAMDVNVTASPCGVPAAAQAYVFNATVVPPGPLGFLTMWQQGQSQPTAATLNALDGAITSNLAIVPTNNGSISVFPDNPTQLVLDLFGYFAP